MVSDKKIFSFLFRYIGKISPAPWQPCFLKNRDDLNNLGRRLLKKHSCNVVLKSVRWFLTKGLLKLSKQIYRENKPRPLVAMFFSSPEHELRVSYCHHPMSVVRRSSSTISLLTHWRSQFWPNLDETWSECLPLWNLGQVRYWVLGSKTRSPGQIKGKT